MKTESGEKMTAKQGAIKALMEGLAHAKKLVEDPELMQVQKASDKERERMLEFFKKIADKLELKYKKFIVS